MVFLVGSPYRLRRVFSAVSLFVCVESDRHFDISMFLDKLRDQKDKSLEIMS